MGNESLPLDRIRIRELTTRTIIGFKDWEREKKQDISITLVLHVNLRAAGLSDDVADTVDYKRIKKQVLALVEGSRFQLIERLAEAVARCCLEETGVERVDVTVDKLGALRFARSVSVEISRSKRDGQG